LIKTKGGSMKNKISALMDGELGGIDMADTITQVKKTEDLRNKWSIYHLIGDTLRQPEISFLDIASGVRNKLAAEPTVLTPELPKEHKSRIFAFAVAASMVTAVAAVAWIGGQTMDQSFDPVTGKAVLQTAVQTKSAEPIAIPVLAQEEKLIAAKSVPQTTIQAESAVTPIPASIQLNDYLFAHEEFSPRTAIRGVSPYMRTVADPYKRPINR
jgi:sigma-E factor negative regulatory protein RseA